MVRTHRVILFAVALIMVNTAVADTTRRGGDDGAAMARAQMMLRQLSQEKEAVQAENAELKKQLASIESKIASLKKEKTSLDQKLGSSQSLVSRYKENTEMLRDRIVKDNERMKELVQKFKELIAAFKVVEQEKAQLKVTLEQNRQELLTCAENNVKLVKNNEELLHQYVQKGVWASLSQAEPVTQLKKVEVEKMAQEYQNTIDLLKISVSEHTASN